ncbi:MAG: signal recognition particle-docking protein FtsY [Eubacterium sp.]
MEQENKGFFNRLFKGLSKTRDSITSGLDLIFSGFSNIDDDLYEELEEILIMSDIGVNTTMKIIDELKDSVKQNHIKKPDECRELLIDIIKKQMYLEENTYDFENKKSIVLIIGVNGVGKTTTIGKLAGQLRANNKKVLLAAADTFRAAATEQLKIWANRSGADIVAAQEGADPGAVIFDAISSAKSKDTDIILCDTAGRLHNKKNLMDELKKIDKIISKEYSDAYRENLIVLDATTGQNALSQAKQFMQVTDITGIILTKMDGTAKGGIAVAIQSELGIPVKYIGVGETIEDLQKFNADSFVDAMFDVSYNE